MTHVDVARLATALDPTLGWLEWLTPDALDLGGETDSWVELREGPRLLVLAQQRDSKQRAACIFLRENEGCSVYPQRPACCRTYPFELGTPPPPADSDRPRVRLALHHDVRCEPETGIALLAARDGEDDTAAEDAPTRDARHTDDEAQAQLAAYVAYVSAWNRRQRRRRLAGRVAETGEAFVRALIDFARSGS